MKILVANKVELINWLSSDLYILDHAHQDEIITDRVYKRLRDAEQPKVVCTKLIDSVISSGEATSSQFLALLKKAEILDTYPQLKKWNPSVALAGKKKGVLFLRRVGVMSSLFNCIIL